MSDWFRNDLKLEVRRDRIILSDSDRNLAVEMVAEQPFSNEVLLVADDAALIATCRRAFREVFKTRFVIRYPTVSITHLEGPVHPVERSAIYRALWNMGVAKIVDQTTRTPTNIPRPK